MRRFTVVIAFVLLVACLHVTHARAEGIQVSDGWARASIGPGSNSAAYLTLTTDGDDPDRLIAAATPLAERAELHDHIMEDGIARMRPVDAIDVVPGEAVSLEPGGLHIMLMGLKKKLEPGMALPVTLSFEKAGEVEIELTVQPMSYRPSMAHEHHGDG